MSHKRNDRLLFGLKPKIMSTLVVFKLSLYLSSPNFPSDFAALFLTLIKLLLKVKVVVYYIMTKMGANELIHCITVNKYGALFRKNN